MNPEAIIQSKISQREKNKYHILTLVYGIQKDGTDEYLQRAAMKTQTQRTDLETRVGRRGKGWDKWREYHGSIYSNICKQIASGNLLSDSGNSKWGSVIIQRGGTGWEVRGRFKREGTYVHLWLFMLVYDRNQTNIINQSSSN